MIAKHPERVYTKGCLFTKVFQFVRKNNADEAYQSDHTVLVGGKRTVMAKSGVQVPRLLLYGRCKEYC